jgi:hypothetical protein
MIVASALWILCTAPVAHTSDDLETQVWGNFTLGWIRSEKVYLELDMEPKILVSGEPEWRNVDVTPSIEYYPSPWIDLTGDVTVGRTVQTDDLRTTELTFCAGVRLNLVKQVQSKLHRERTPLGRISAATLVRLEERNFWYSDGTDPQHDVRLRVRLGFKTPINHASLAMDRTFYFLADAEGYVPLSDEVDERYASKLQGRIGLGYRFNARHRVDLLYILDRTKNTIDDTPHSTTQAFDFRYRVTFR